MAILYCLKYYKPDSENWRVTSEQSTNLRQNDRAVCSQGKCDEWNGGTCPYKG